MTARKPAQHRPPYTQLTPQEVELIRRLYEEEMARGGGAVDRLGYRRIAARFAGTRVQARGIVLHRRRLLAKTARAQSAG